MLRLENVSFSYGREDILHDVSMNIEDGKIYAVIGRTGSGKSTLIRHFNGLLKPSSGRVIVDNEDISKKKTDIKNVREKIGMVFQYPEHQLFAETVYEDIAFGPKNLGLEGEALESCVRYAAMLMSVSDEMLKKSPFELSGGEQRRAAAAGVLAMRPETIVLDEPSAGLDPGARREMYRILRNIHDSSPNGSIVFVTHSMDEAAELADYIYVLENGRILLEGEPNEVFSHEDILRGAGLGIPKAAELIAELRRRGAAAEFACTAADAARVIADILRNAG